MDLGDGGDSQDMVFEPFTIQPLPPAQPSELFLIEFLVS